MRLTPEYLRSVFLECGYDEFELNSAWLVTHRSKEEKGIKLRYALDCVREQAANVSVFVEHILQPSDLDEVSYVIERLYADSEKRKFKAAESLRMLQAWRAHTLMQIVIEKRNRMISTSERLDQGFVCD